MADEKWWGDLRQMMIEKSGASDAKIDVDRLLFEFTFLDGSLRDHPWKFARLKPDLTNWPKAARPLALRRASTIVWKRILEAFNRAVKDGAVVLYACPKTVLAEPEPLASEVWPMLQSINWLEGTAFTPDGIKLYLIRVKFANQTSGQRATLGMIKKKMQEKIDSVSRATPPHGRDLIGYARRELKSEGYIVDQKDLNKAADSAEIKMQRRGKGRPRNQLKPL